MTVCYVALCLAQPRRSGTGNISPAHQATTSTFQGAQARLVKKLKRMFSPAFMDLPSPAQRLDFSLALTHTQHTWRLKD
jgi:hypothetical protein